MDFLKKKHLALLCIAALGLCAVRVFALFFGVDAASGYSNSVLWTVIQAVVCVAAGISFVLPILFKNRWFAYDRSADNSLFRLACWAAFSVYLAKTAFCFMEFFNATDQIILTHILKTFPWEAFANILLSAVSVLFFGLLYVNKGKIFNRGALLLLIGPIGLYTLRFISLFMTLTMNPGVSVYSLSLLATGLAMLFLSAVGRGALTGNIKTLLLWGRLFVLAAAFSQIALLVAQMLGRALLPEISTIDLVCDGALLLYAVANLQLIHDNAIE